MQGPDVRGDGLPIDLVAASPVSVQLTVTTAAMVPVNLSAAVIVARVLSDGVPVMSFTAAVTGASSNVLTISLSGANATTLAARSGLLPWQLTVDTVPWLAGIVTVHDEGSPRSGSTNTTFNVTTGNGLLAAVTVSGTTATAVSIADAADYFTGGNVELALAALGASRAALPAEYAPLIFDPFLGPFPAWFNGGTVNQSLADIVTKTAPLASPTFTGVPVAPTAVTATNTTQLATTAYVKANRTQQAATDALAYQSRRTELWLPAGDLRAVTLATETVSNDTPIISTPAAGSSEMSCVIRPAERGVAHWLTFDVFVVGMALDAAGGDISITALAVNGYAVGDAVAALPGPAGATLTVGGDKVVQELAIESGESWPAAKPYVRVGFTRFGNAAADTAGAYGVIGLLLVRVS